jgi:DNA replication and repair protein RecN
MLAELTIKNFAIIDQLSLSFQNGFTVLTGETGAGKSIIIDAIQLLTGGRGSSEWVRHGAEKAEIEGLFLVGDDHPSIKKLEELGIEAEEGMIILRREIHATGKSLCRINGKLVTISSLREAGGPLVDIHGQHEHQELLDSSTHLALLDGFGGEEHKRALEKYTSLYREYVEAKRELDSLSEDERRLAQKLDLLNFQKQELEAAHLEMGEDEQLEQEKRILTNFERLYEGVSAAYEALRGEQRGLDWLGMAMGSLEEAAGIDESYEKMSQAVSDFYYQLEDISSDLRQRLDMMEYDPGRLNEIESRLAVIHQLKRKYGKTIEEILEYAGKINEEIERITNRDSHRESLKNRLESLEKDLLAAGRHLSRIRKKIADSLTRAIHKELKDLYMEKAEFEVHFHERSGERFRPDGLDEVEFYISTNPGEPKKPLSKIASGGELSRILLALKSIFAKHRGVTSIIFDEVDTGVSGRVAQAIGEKIRRLSVGSQVLAITHLPQVACMSDHHYYISKEVKNNRTITKIQPLDEEGRIKEIARMIAGNRITEATERNARELLETARLQKA